jgi:transcriptional regulator with XRE-family HTH domain
MPTRTKPQIDPQEGFGRAIKALRAEQGVSQEDLADRCEMSRAQLSKVERGLADLRLSTVFRLASALDMSGAELIQRTEDILKASSKRRAGA